MLISHMMSLCSLASENRNCEIRTASMTSEKKMQSKFGEPQISHDNGFGLTHFKFGKFETAVISYEKKVSLYFLLDSKHSTDMHALAPPKNDILCWVIK